MSPTRFHYATLLPVTSIHTIPTYTDLQLPHNPSKYLSSEYFPYLATLQLNVIQGRIFILLQYSMSTAIQSKLMMQINKQQLQPNKQKPQEKRLEDVFAAACKAEPGNMKLVEFINLTLDKGLMTNSHGLRTYSSIFQQFSNKSIETDTMNLTKSAGINPDEEKKFHKQKFIRVFSELAKRLYPGDEGAFEKYFYNRLLGIDGEDGRMKIDQTIRKFLTKESIKQLLQYEEDLAKVFVMYIPQNYNKGLDFTWSEAKMLDRRIPMVCLLKMLWECEVYPNYISVTGLFQMLAKYLPISSSYSREGMFYSPESLAGYAKDVSSGNTVKIVQGDIGLYFYEFQLIMVRISFQISKDNQQKPDFPAMIRKLLSELVGLRTSSQTTFPEIRKKTKLNSRIMGYCQKQVEFKAKKAHKKSIGKIQPSNELDDYLEIHDAKDDEVMSPKIHQKLFYDLQTIRRSIDEDTPLLPQPVKQNKQNEGYYDINQKYVVIGQQLPKIQDKAKPTTSEPKKQQDELLGYKPQIQKPKKESYAHFKQMMNSAYRTRKEEKFYPILLSEIATPQNLQQSSQLYVQTAFINLAEHNYQNALKNLRIARQLQKTSRVQNELFFYFIEGQVYEAMGKDQKALDSFFKCKEISINFKNNDVSIALPYCGLGSCLYHAQQYEYSARCYLKAKEIRQKVLEPNSVEIANLYNNLGCCYLKLDRAQEARKLFQLSHSILDLQLGVYHQKTLTVYQNLSKAKKCYVERIPEYKVLWRSYQRKQGLPQPKKKTK